MPEIFTNNWSDSLKEALNVLKQYLNDLQFIQSERTREKIQNMAFALFVDGYVERLILALNKSLKIKEVKGLELTLLIYPSLWQEKKL